MNAIVRRRYGPPDVIEVADVDKPEPSDDEVCWCECAPPP